MFSVPKTVLCCNRKLLCRLLGQTLVSKWNPTVPEIPTLSAQHVALGDADLNKGASYDRAGSACGTCAACLLWKG